jgi:hypothetical protein
VRGRGGGKSGESDGGPVSLPVIAAFLSLFGFAGTIAQAARANGRTGPLDHRGRAGQSSRRAPMTAVSKV